MVEITLCPHYLVDYPYENINDIEDNIINCLLELIEKIESEDNLDLVISENIFQLCRDGYPWNLFEDQSWAGILSIWCNAVWPYLGRAKILPHNVKTTTTDLKKCINISLEVHRIFEGFLDCFGKLEIARIKNEEAIFTHTNCCYPSDYRGFLIIDHEFKNFRILKNPWLRIYPNDSQLPIEGEYQFIPPGNWSNSLKPLKSPIAPYGFIDNEGKVWCWDMLHKNHWDVQFSGCSKNGEYLNISPEGKLL